MYKNSKYEYHSWKIVTSLDTTITCRISFGKNMLKNSSTTRFVLTWRECQKTYNISYFSIKVYHTANGLRVTTRVRIKPYSHTYAIKPPSVLDGRDCCCLSPAYSSALGQAPDNHPARTRLTRECMVPATI